MRTPDGRVEGTVTQRDGHQEPFSGWLDLSRLLELGLDADESPNAAASGS